jgi:hypothetical protein
LTRYRTRQEKRTWQCWHLHYQRWEVQRLGQRVKVLGLAFLGSKRFGFKVGPGRKNFLRSRFQVRQARKLFVKFTFKVH